MINFFSQFDFVKFSTKKTMNLNEYSIRVFPSMILINNVVFLLTEKETERERVCLCESEREKKTKIKKSEIS